MPIGVVTVEIIQPGEWAENLLAAAGARLQTSSVRELNGEVAQFWLDNATAEEAYEAVQGALDAVGADWPEYLELHRPSS